MAKGASFEDIAKKLTASSTTKENLAHTLKNASGMLSDVQQSSPPETLSAIQPVAQALSRSQFINHKDKDVRLYTASCINEILRIFAPDAPYDEPILKDIFYLFLRVFQGLDDTSANSFHRTVTILETLATVKTCVVMLDLECDDLILEMFKLFFSVCSPNHPENVLARMGEIMSTIIGESENISDELLDTILIQLIQNKSAPTRSTAYQLAVNLLKKCSSHLEPFVHRFLTNAMVNKRVQNERPYDLHQVIFEIYKADSQLLVAVLPNLQEQLLIDQETVRLKTVSLLGKIFALPDRRAMVDYRQLYSDFIGRFKDKSTEIRLKMIQWSESILSSPTITQEISQEILSLLLERLLDFEEKVRMSVVKVICSTARKNSTVVTVEALKSTSERLLDKKLSIRKTALVELLEVYKSYCARCASGKETSRKEIEWIPTKLIRCILGKEFKENKNQALDSPVEKEMFPSNLNVEERCWHWILMYSTIEDIDRKALKYFFTLKSRLNQEMLHYLDLRQKMNEDDRESNRELTMLFKNLSTRFANPVEAEESFTKLNRIKDNYVFESLSSLLNAKSTLEEVTTAYDQCLKRFGDTNSLHEFMNILCCRISYLLFCKEHVKAFFLLLSSEKVKVVPDFTYSTIQLLQDISTAFPVLFSDSLKEIFNFLSTEDEKKKEFALNIFANAGNYMQENFSEYADRIKEIFEEIALKGNRKQSKLAILSISSVFKDSKNDFFESLMKKLMSSLSNDDELPTILQSIGFIAKASFSAYQPHEDSFFSFITEDIFKRTNTYESDAKNDWEHPSKECLLKQYGLKTLVKSFLSPEGGLERPKLRVFLELLLKLLSQGSLTQDNSSDCDLAHLRLSAAKCVFKLSRKWESHLTAKHFTLTVLTSMDPVLEVRKEFLKKLPKYLFNKVLHIKYASAFILASSDSNADLALQSKQWLTEALEFIRNQSQIPKGVNVRKEESDELTSLPEYILVYFIFALSNYSNLPSLDSDASAFEPHLKQILSVLLTLLNSETESRGQRKDDEADNLPVILFLLRSMKNTKIINEDDDKTQNMYALCDTALMIAKELGKRKIYSQSFHGKIFLPSAMLDPLNLGDSDIKSDESNLPKNLKNLDLEKLKSKLISTTFKPKVIAKREAKRVKKSVEYSEESDKESESRGDKDRGKGKETEKADFSAENGPSKKRIKSDVLAESDVRKRQEKAVQEPAHEKPLKAKSAKFSDKDKNGTSQVVGAKTPKKSNQPSETLDGEELVGKRVKVWWPDDKMYYFGTVAKYTASRNRHKVVYDDGDVENLVMRDEKWFLVEESDEQKSPTPAKKRGPGRPPRSSTVEKVKPKTPTSDIPAQKQEDSKKIVSSLSKAKRPAAEEKNDTAFDSDNTSKERRKRNNTAEDTAEKRQKVSESTEKSAEGREAEEKMELDEPIETVEKQDAAEKTEKSEDKDEGEKENTVKQDGED